MNPATGEIYAHEHGPRGGDELNLIKPNTNYGWPAVSFGVNYDGSLVSPDTTRPGMTLPLTYWVPSIAPSGMTFIRTGQPDNEADILIGALAGTHIHWLKMKDDKRVSSTRSMNGYARFRDIRQAPDGKLYAMTETPNRFVLLRSSVPVTVSVEEDEPTPSAIILRGNYPNPFNPVTSIVFELASPQSVTLEVFNAMGQRVAQLADSQWFTAGTHEVSYSGLTTPSGMYFVRISSESGSATSKMLLIK